MKNIKGFTLIEVLVALSILAALAVLVSGTWAANVRRHLKSEINVKAAQLLQLKLTELEAEYKDNVASLPLEQEQTGKFEGQRYQNFTWTWQAKNMELPDLGALMDTDGEDTILVAVLSQFRDYLVASIREVEVTVTYQKGKQPALNYTVATYLVDYSQNISMGLPSGAGGNSGSGNGGTPQNQQQQNSNSNGLNRGF